MCGEHTCFSAETAAYAGSSPRVRGTQEGSHGGFTWRGIIPACAGNTSRPNAEPESWRDHPRVCGEHDTRGIRRLHNSGSSPRVRGTRCAPSKPVHLTGIIPACAGNTGSAILNGLLNGDHPRVCGEHLDGGFAPRRCGGSSPRVRGTRSAPRMPLRCTGIIPACAGNTPAKAASPSRNRDHPRVCGEHVTPSEQMVMG